MTFLLNPLATAAAFLFTALELRPPCRVRIPAGAKDGVSKIILAAANSLDASREHGEPAEDITNFDSGISRAWSAFGALWRPFRALAAQAPAAHPFASLKGLAGISQPMRGEKVLVAAKATAHDKGLPYHLAGEGQPADGVALVHWIKINFSGRMKWTIAF